MENYQIMQAGRILAEFTRVLGMQAENMQKQQQGQPIQYGEDAFNVAAANIEFYVEQLK
jgi:hypothetical protein